MPRTLQSEMTDEQALALFRARWCTSTEAAAILGIVPGAVRKIVSEGRLHCKKMGRDLFIRRAELEEYRRVERRGPKPGSTGE